MSGQSRYPLRIRKKPSPSSHLKMKKPIQKLKSSTRKRPSSDIFTEIIVHSYSTKKKQVESNSADPLPSVLTVEEQEQATAQQSQPAAASAEEKPLFDNGQMESELLTLASGRGGISLQVDAQPLLLALNEFARNQNNVPVVGLVDQEAEENHPSVGNPIASTSNQRSTLAKTTGGSSAMVVKNNAEETAVDEKLQEIMEHIRSLRKLYAFVSGDPKLYMLVGSLDTVISVLTDQIKKFAMPESPNDVIQKKLKIERQ